MGVGQGVGSRNPAGGRPVMKSLIKTVGTGPHGSKDLTADQAREAAIQILDGKATPAQTGALLLAIRTKGESDTEMEGFFMEARSRIASRTPAPPILEALDIGDPYDGHTRTPGLAIPAAIWASLAGLKIVLHGYPDLPAKFGVGHTQVWESMGLKITPFEKSVDALRHHGVVCLSQEEFLPEWTRLRPLRQELGLRTLLNTVEKSLNPLNARTMLTGYFHENLASRLHVLLEKIFPGHTVSLIAGSEGSVDLHAHRPTRIHETSSETPQTSRTISPPEGTFPLPSLPLTAQSHAQFALDVLRNRQHPHRPLVRAMAAHFLCRGGVFGSMETALSALPEDCHSPILEKLPE